MAKMRGGPSGPGGNSSPGGNNRGGPGTPGGEGGGDRGRRGDRGNQAAREPRSKLYSEDVVKINRCAKVVKGGKRFSFAAFVVLGDGKNKVGFGKGKAKEVASSIDKAVRDGEKVVRAYPIVNGTIPHEVEGRFGASKVRLIPASEGTGVIAGRSVRAVLQKAGVHNVLTKAYGSHNPVNLIRATIDALSKLRTKEQYEQLRGIQL
ncbi:MAG: 30S ribosomal protein S5 [Planctomycetes bacterium]|nr:30S ribosomal protein S5 [Planctomycetota bacterium]